MRRVIFVGISMTFICMTELRSSEINYLIDLKAEGRVCPTEA